MHVNVSSSRSTDWASTGRVANSAGGQLDKESLVYCIADTPSMVKLVTLQSTGDMSNSFFVLRECVQAPGIICCISYSSLRVSIPVFVLA